MSIDIILGIVGIVLGIVGIIAGYIFYLWGKREKEPCFSLKHVNLIKGYSSVFTDLKIKYKQKEIENLTVTKIVFWNHGTETIDKGDIETTLPLMITAFEGTTILDIEILKSSNLANRFSTELADDQQSALLQFDYLNGQDGAVIQVIHTGVSLPNLWITGQIKGVNKIKYKLKREDIYSTAFRVFLYFYGIATLVILSLDIYHSIFLEEENDVFNFPPWFLVTLWLGIVFALILDIRLFSKMARIPKALSIFDKDVQNNRIK